MKKWLVLLLCLMSHISTAKELEKTNYYDDAYPQCRSYKIFIGNTLGTYKDAYTGKSSLKKANENASDNALNMLKLVEERNLPSPFSYNDLLNDALNIKTAVFNGQEVSWSSLSSKAYDYCVKILVDNGFQGTSNENYDQKVDYSKGQDKIKSEKVTKVEQACNSKSFPKLMENARVHIKEFAEFRNLTLDKYLNQIHYKSINRLAEDMFQAGLDDGTVQDQFLWDMYNFPGRGIKSGSLEPRCSINK